MECPWTLFDDFKKDIPDGRNVVIDNTNATTNVRSKFIDFLKEEAPHV